MFRLLFFLCYYIGYTESVSITSVPLPQYGYYPQSPFYDIETDSVYFVDLLGTLLYRYSRQDDKIVSLTVDGVSHPGFFMPLQGSRNQYVTSTGNEVVIVNWNGHSSTGTIDRTVFNVTQNTWIHRAFPLPNGKFYVGNYGHEYCNEAPTKTLYEYTNSNGLETEATHFVATVAMILVNNVFYLLDPCTKILWGFDWSPCSGQLSNQRAVLFLNIPDEVIPLGLTASTDGILYIAGYQGSVIYKIDPRIPAIVGGINLPVPYPTAMTFGDPNYQTLYVTTSDLNVNFYTNVFGPSSSPPSGNLFKIKGLGVTGVPSYRPNI